MVKEVASQTNDQAGDGTTTATVLAQAIVNEGLKSVAAGMNPLDLKRGIDKAIVAAIDKSMCPAIISNAIGNAIIAFSVKLNVASDKFQISKK